MVARRKSDIAFSPNLRLIASLRADSPYTAFAGPNNCGKSLSLRSLKRTFGRSAYLMGTNRFYHVHQFSSSLRNPNELDQLENQFSSQWSNEDFNFEQNVFDLNSIIIGLSNVQRTRLFTLCGDLIGSKISMKKVVEDNDLSPHYIDMDGQNIAVGSTGTRLLLTLLGICMDERFDTVLIDEPELGLGPKLQTVVADFLQNPTARLKVFSHLKRIFVSTHSHIFLSRRDVSDNFVISKELTQVTLKRVQTISELHTLQFNLLGNALETLYFPSAIIIVEGAADLHYLRRIVELHFAGRRVTVVDSQGDPKARVHGLRDTLGDLPTSPFRNRLFVVVDSVHSRGLRAELIGMGLLEAHFIQWARNGIEYYYPRSILEDVYKISGGDADRLTITDDRVEANGISKTKMELNREVVSRLSAETILPPEIANGFLASIRDAIG